MKKMSIPGANNWIEDVFIMSENPHKLIIVAKANSLPHRQLRAKLFVIAAEFELRTEEKYKWIINIDGIAHYGQGRKAMSIHIELSDESIDEFYASERLVQEIALDLKRDVLRP